MSGQVENGSICLTCNNAATCMFTRYPGQPVLRCEEFVIDRPAPLITVHEGDLSLDSPAGEGDPQMDPGLSEFIGLCKTCDERNSCRFPRSESGVWHCEEYR